MVTNVKMMKTDRVDSGTLLKRFQKKMQESGIVPKVKSQKHAQRGVSKLKIKKDKLVNLEAARKYENLKKMGKLAVRTYRPQAATPTSTVVATK